MKRGLLGTLALLICVVSLTDAAGAAGVRVRLHEPRVVSNDTVRLSGTVRGRDVVRIQRYLNSSRRWRTVARVTARKDGSFRTSVPTADYRRVFRAKAGTAVSNKQVVPATTPVPSDACGPRPRKADGSRWACTLAENFTGTELDRSIWRPQVGFKAGSLTGMPCYIDDPSVISVQNGSLRLSVRHVSQPLLPCLGLNVLPTAHVAGGVSTYRLFSQQYGRFEARFKNTPATVPGLQESFWLWPDDRQSIGIWPAAGEIDVAETYSQHPRLAIPFLHYTWNDNGGPKPGLNTAWDCAAKRGEYNTYTLEWTANRIKILVNGKTCLVNTSGDPAFQKPYIMALTQMLGTGANAYDGRAPLPATMTVDYVKVWK